MKVYSLEEITSSNIMYKRNPPKFMFYIITIVLLLIISFITWSCYSVKTFVVKGQGVVTRENKVNVMTKVSGEIKEIYVKEGQEVKAGDVLLVFNAVEPNLQISQSEEQLKYLNRRIELLKRAEQEVEKGINTFNRKNEEERDFYNRIQSAEIKINSYKESYESYKKQQHKDCNHESNELSESHDDSQIEDYKRSVDSQISDIKYQTILSFTNEKQNLIAEKIRVESQKMH